MLIHRATRTCTPGRLELISISSIARRETGRAEWRERDIVPFAAESRYSPARLSFSRANITIVPIWKSPVILRQDTLRRAGPI